MQRGRMNEKQRPGNVKRTLLSTSDIHPAIDESESHHGPLARFTVADNIVLTIG